MRICLKRKISVGNKSLQKHQEGFILGIHWSEDGKFQYYVDFGKEGSYIVESSECDILNAT